MTTRSLGRRPHPDTPIAADLYPITAHRLYRATASSIHYWYEGETWLDQGATGTCVGNAFAHRYADATVTHPGIDEAWARELYVAASGDTTLQEGTSAILAARVMKARGQISAYHWVSSPEELRNTLTGIGPVLVGVDWYASFDHPVAGENDRAYLMLDKDSPLRGGHEFVVNGINLVPDTGPPFYRMKNSWSRSWPGDAMTGIVMGPGTARIPCDQLDELLFRDGGDCCLITEVA